MSHLRDTALLTQGPKDSTSPPAFLMEQLPREMQCQFILKPSHLAVAQQPSGEWFPPSQGLLLAKVFISGHRFRTKARS